MNYKTCLLLVAGLAALNACQTTGESEDKVRGIAAYAKDARLGPAVDKICFKRNIDGFRKATRDTVILDAGVRDEYIVEVMGGCQVLRHAQAIQLDSNLSCLSKFDNLIVYDSAFGTQSSPMSVDRCAIRAIHKWDEKALEDTTDETDEDTDFSTRPMK